MNSHAVFLRSQASMTETFIPKICYNCCMLLIHKTYQVRAYTTSSGYDRIASVLLNCARLYNSALEEWKYAYRHKGHSLSVALSKFDQMKEFTGVRSDDPEFWGAISVQIGRGVLTRLDRARLAFYKRVERKETPGFPRFKSASRWNTIELPETTEYMVKKKERGHVIRIKGLPTLRLKKGIELPSAADLKTITITKRGRRLWVNLAYAVEHVPLQTSNSAVGLDMGVVDRVALSTGERLGRRPKPNTKLKRAQQRMSRCRKGSRRWKQRRAVLANAQDRERIRNRNECHRITTDLVRRFGLIALEDLPIKNMTASAKGTMEQPGKQVSQKAGLNRSIAEQTWGLIKQQLICKAAWAGRELVSVDPKFTSQRCSGCGAVSAGHRQLKRYNCTECGMTEDADINAARNILHKGLAGGNVLAAALDAA